jgi:hypothetical protein
MPTKAVDGSHFCVMEKPNVIAEEINKMLTRDVDAAHGHTQSKI